MFVCFPMDKMQHFITFSSDQLGLERILRLFQSIAQIILGVPFLALTATAWINKLPSTVAALSALNTIGDKASTVPAPPFKVADTLLLFGDLKNRLALARRTVRLFWFLGSFQAAQQLLYHHHSTGSTGNSSSSSSSSSSSRSLEVWLDIASRSFNGMYLMLETVTMPDVMGTPGLRLWGPALSKTLNVEAQRFWLLGLVCAAASGCLKLLRTTYGRQSAVPETAERFGAQVGKKDKKEKEEAKEAANAASAASTATALVRERSAKRRALLRKLVADVLDMAAPGVVVGWVHVDAGTVGLTMFVTTLLSGYELWKKAA